MDEAQAGCLYRCCQEALTNVARHAEARRVRLSLAQGGGMLRLTVADDGIGTEASAKGPPRMGMAGLRERIHPLGGTLTVRSSAGQGTTLVIELPVNPPPA